MLDAIANRLTPCPAFKESFIVIATIWCMQRLRARSVLQNLHAQNGVVQNHPFHGLHYKIALNTAIFRVHEKPNKSPLDDNGNIGCHIPGTN